MTDTLDIKSLPDPIKVKIEQPPAPAKSPWGPSIQYMRDIAKWITGGVVATAAAIATGASLTQLGSLSLLEQPLRTLLAFAGLALGVLAISKIFQTALCVFTSDAATLDDVILAKESEEPMESKLHKLKLEVERSFSFERDELSWSAVTNSKETGLCEDPKLATRIEGMLGFLNIRLEFLDLQRSLYRWGPIAMIGFVAFAWAANPGVPKPNPAPQTAEVVEFEYDEQGRQIRRTTRTVTDTSRTGHQQ